MDILKSITSRFSRKEKGYSLTNLSFAELFSVGKPGLRGNYDAYRKSLYVYACVSKIAEKIAGIELELFQITNSKGDTKQVPVHAILDLLYKPGPSQTKAEMMESIVINLLLGGEAFAYKIRNESGSTIDGLKVLRTDYVNIVKNKDGDILYYEFDKRNGEKINIQPQDIIHWKFFNPFEDGRGFSPITPAKSRIETENYASMYQRDFFERDAQPKAVIKLSGTATKDQKDMLREDFESRYSGKNRESNVAILEGGMEYERVSLGQKEMDYIESMRATRDDILVAFKVPKPIIAIVDDVNLANSKTAMSIFLGETIEPLMRRIVEKFNEEMVYDDFDPRFFLSFDDPTPEDKTAKEATYQNGIQNGWLLANEIRQWEGLPPMVGGWTRYIPSTMVAVGGLSSAGKSIEGSQDEIAKYYEGVRNKNNAKMQLKNMHGKALVREVFTEIDSIKKRLHQKTMQKLTEKGYFEKKAEEAKAYSELSRIKSDADRMEFHKAINEMLDTKAQPFAEKIKDFFDDQSKRAIAKVSKIKSLETKASAKDILNKDAEAKLFATIAFPFIEKYVKESGDAAIASMAPAETFDPTPLQKKIDKRVSFLSDSVISTTIDRVLSVVQDGIDEGYSITQISDMVRELYKDMSLYRADLIARTETTYANNMGLEESYKQSGVATHKEWVATLDSATRDEHLQLNGEVVELGAEFSNGLEYPQEPNCRCVVAPAFKE